MNKNLVANEGFQIIADDLPYTRERIQSLVDLVNDLTPHRRPARG